MASSNRHWPSMFKSKPCNPNHQFPHDSLNSSTAPPGCNKSPYTSGCEEKAPEPKPRWNPKAEQIRILEGIFNSGMVNPPREEIRKIRIQLQEYGQVGDANVFYWFQNRKSRTKHKLRNLTKHHNASTSSSSSHSPLQNTNPNPANSSSSSNNSSDKLSSPPKDQISIISAPNPNIINHNNDKGFSNVVISTDLVVPNSPTASVNQTFFQPLNNNNNDTINHHLIPPTTTKPQSADHESFFPVVYHHNTDAAITTTTQGQGSYDFVSQLFHQQPNYPYGQQQPCTNMLLSEIMMSHHEASSKNNKYLHDHDDHDQAIKVMNQQNQSQFISFCQASTTNFVPSITTTTTTVTVPSPITHQFRGVGDAASTARSTVFINDVVFEVGVGPFNVREAFGEEAVLIQSSGHPILTDQWGVTLHPLQHGASYYLI